MHCGYKTLTGPVTSTAKKRRFLSAGKKFARAAMHSPRVLARHCRYLASSAVRRTSALCSSSACGGEGVRAAGGGGVY